MITTLFWDVGGVMLTNGWDISSRKAAAEKFRLDWDNFSERHEYLLRGFETGRMTLDEYLDRAVFYESRPFSRDEFKAFMFAQSRAFPETIQIVSQLAQSQKHLMGILNNECLELNLYRLDKFGLRSYFTIFLSSCFVRVRKPEAAIYAMAVQVVQQRPDQCLFIDDRQVNIECARKAGLQTILFQSAHQLDVELKDLGIGA